MQITALARRVLQLVFALSSNGATLTRPRLERRLEVSSVALNEAIAELSRSGLLDAQRLRLTFPGLAMAVASGARSTAEPRALAAKAPRPTAVRAPIALFSQREAPRAVA
jgi:DNA-binding GntR family transcriptional regulator